MSNPRTSARTIAMTGMLSAIAFILMIVLLAGMALMRRVAGLRVQGGV